MTDAIALREPATDLSPLSPWSAMDDEQRGLLKQACSGANLSDAQFALLVEVARRSGLDPFRRHIYGLVLGGKFTIIAGVDGFLAVARRNGLAGIDAPVFEYLDEQKRIPTSCTITVYRNGPAGRESYTAKRFMRECMRNTPIWKERPHDMLAKCTKVMAIRDGFTESLGSVYERDELPSSTETRHQSRLVGPAPKDIRELLAKPEEQAEAVDAEWHPTDPDRDPTDSEAP